MLSAVRHAHLGARTAPAVPVQRSLRPRRACGGVPAPALSAARRCVRSATAVAQAIANPRRELRTSPHSSPIATYQGHAQLIGLCKKQIEDVVLMERDIALSTWDSPYGSGFADLTDSDSPAACVSLQRRSEALNALQGLQLPGVDASAGAALISTDDKAAELAALPNLKATGVFDGHGGKSSALLAHTEFQKRLASDLLVRSAMARGDVSAISALLAYMFCDVDATVLSQPGVQDGTTALLTLQLGGLLVVANAGDCRAVLSRGGQAVRLSQDHTPGLRSERARIEAAGGKEVEARGAARVAVPLPGQPNVMRTLAVSRSLGDAEFKVPGFVTAEPDVCVVPLQEGTDAFLIAASDGLWGRVSDQNAVDCVAGVLQNYAGMPRHRASAPKAAARALLALAADSGSTDDVSVVVSVFHWGA